MKKDKNEEKQNTDYLTEYKKKMFSHRFDELFRERWKGSNESFANKMNELYESKGITSRRRKGEFRTCSHQQVQKWRKEGQIPDRVNLKCISEILGVEPEYFFYQMSFEKAFLDTEHVSKEDRVFNKDLESVGIDKSFFDFLVSRDHFSTRFPFHPNDLDTVMTPEYLDSGIKSKRRFEYQDGRFRRIVTMSKNDLRFIKDIQDEIENTISRMFWDKFEEYRKDYIEYQIKHQSEMEEIPVEVVRDLYSQNRDWFIRSSILLRHQLMEDWGALDDLIWNYRVEHKIPIPERELEDAHYNVLPDIDEWNRLRHEDRAELRRKAQEEEDRFNKESNEYYIKRIKELNEAIQSGAAKKIERRK